MSIYSDIRKCVIFIGYQNADGIYCFGGTAFYVFRPVDGVDGGFIYLVTAKHVIDKIRSKGSDKVWLRVNLKDGRAIWLHSSIENWHSHPSDDEVVDVSVLRTNIHDSLDHLALPWSTIYREPPSKERYKVNVGLEVFLAGLFSNHSGQNRNIPIIRVGNVCALPEEEVQTELGYMEAYLVEARSFGGISGAPVFVRFPGLGVVPNPPGTPKGSSTFGLRDAYYLLGLMHGHWNLNESPDSDSSVMDVQGEKSVNTGIAIVVPVSKMVEVIEQPMFRRLEKPIVDGLRTAGSVDTVNT